MHGKGGYSYEEVYRMPVHIRRFHISELKKLIEAENKEANKSANSSSSPTIHRPPPGAIKRPSKSR